MQQLITIQSAAIGTDAIPTCNARDLHEFLEVQTQFKDWIARRIEEYDFEEDKDFCCSNLSGKKEGSGGHNRKDYHLSLDMAKELSMVERTEKGKQARQYFIECERQAKTGGQAKIGKQQPPLKQLSDAARAFKTVFQSLLVLDLNKNAAAISANRAIRKQSNLDFLAITGNEQLKAENQESPHYCPTELGEFIGLTARQVNQALLVAGLQHKPAGRWWPTEKGRHYAFIADVDKQHKSGASVQQVRWYASVLPIIEQLINQQEAA